MKINLFTFLMTINYVYCGNILFISPLPSPSHHLWNKIISMELIRKGHNITMLSHDTEKKPIPNFTVITMPGMYEVLREGFKMEDCLQYSTLTLIRQTLDFSEFLCEYDLKSEGLEKLINYPKDFKFDLIIYDVTVCQCFYPLAQRFNNPPLIGVTAYLLPPYVSYAFGNHLHPAYTPFYGTDFTSNMTAFQRVLNFIYTYLQSFLRYYFTTQAEFQMAKERFGENIRPLEEVERNITLLLSNTDPTLNAPIALPPNIIPVGGLHVRPAQPLPKDLEEIMNSAKNGVILLSLGTNIKSANLKDEIKQTFLKAFAKLPQTVLWKFETDDLKNIPNNVIIRKWLPQNDVLGHPNIKLFLSHGGSLSTQEAMYHGVPVVGIPFFSDQFLNIHQMKSRGIAEHIDLRKNVTADEMYEKIQMVLNSNSYKSKIDNISKLYRDRPQTALEKAIFWIEYVMRHGTAEHLVLPARDMPSYKTGNLDVLAVAVSLIVLLYVLISKLILKCSRYFESSKKSRKIKLS